MAADVEERPHGVITVANDDDRHICDPGGDERAALREVARVAHVLPRAAEDALPLELEDGRIGVPAPGQAPDFDRAHEANASEASVESAGERRREVERRVGSRRDHARRCGSRRRRGGAPPPACACPERRLVERAGRRDCGERAPRGRGRARAVGRPRRPRAVRRRREGPARAGTATAPAVNSSSCAISCFRTRSTTRSASGSSTSSRPSRRASRVTAASSAGWRSATSRSTASFVTATTSPSGAKHGKRRRRSGRQSPTTSASSPGFATRQRARSVTATGSRSR